MRPGYRFLALAVLVALALLAASTAGEHEPAEPARERSAEPPPLRVEEPPRAAPRAPRSPSRIPDETRFNASEPPAPPPEHEPAVAPLEPPATDEAVIGPELAPPLAEPPECGDETLPGRCDGDSVVLCFGGRIQTLDCAAQGLVCTEAGEEGAECQEPPPPCPDDLPRCEGAVLDLCGAHGPRTVDCGERDARCEITPGGGGRCVRVVARDQAPPADDDCGPCGCPPAVDLLQAGSLPILAFVITGRGVSRWGDDAAVEQEVAVMAALLEPAGIEVQLSEVVRLEREDWIEADDVALQEMFRDPSLRPARDAPYAPVVFTDALRRGLAPRLGVSMPGLVVLSHGRHWTTGAHELGHFLGLHHTHEAASEPVVTRIEWPGGAVECEECRTTGDGICDTPADPGRSGCTYVVPACQPICVEGQSPDVGNLMSYYHDCRSHFSDEQAAKMRATLLSLRLSPP